MPFPNVPANFMHCIRHVSDRCISATHVMLQNPPAKCSHFFKGRKLLVKWTNPNGYSLVLTFSNKDHHICFLKKPTKTIVWRNLEDFHLVILELKKCAIHYLQITTPKSGIQLFLARKPSFPHWFSAELPSRAAAQPLERHRGPEQEILENLIAPVDM